MSLAVAFFATTTLLSGQDSLTQCDVNESGKFVNCLPVQGKFASAGSQLLWNISGLSFYNGDLFVTNYGTPFYMGTSYISRCSYNPSGTFACFPYLGLASNYHITNAMLTDKKTIFVDSYVLRNTEESRAYNYLLVCDPKTNDKGMLKSCSTSKLLRGSEAGPQPLGYNTSMDIALQGNDIYVTDRAAQKYFKCTYTTETDNLNCEDGPVTESGFTPALVDIKGNFKCTLASEEDKNVLECCSLSSKECTTVVDQGILFDSPLSLSIDEKNNSVYLANSAGLEAFTHCTLNPQGSIVGNCERFSPSYKNSSKSFSGVASKILVITP